MIAEFTVTCLKVQLQRGRWRPFNERQINGVVKITLKLISQERRWEKLPVLGEEKHDQRSIIHLKQLSGALWLSAQEQWSTVTNRSVIHYQHAQMRQAHRGHHEKCLLSILWLFTIEPSNYYRWNHNNQFSPGWSLRSRLQRGLSSL